MPRGNPGKLVALRLDPALVAAVKDSNTPNLTRAVEEGLRWWLAREKRKAAKPDPLAKRLAPPTARERAVRRRA